MFAYQLLDSMHKMVVVFLIVTYHEELFCDYFRLIRRTLHSVHFQHGMAVNNCDVNGDLRTLEIRRL